jgi:hypothetical protein
VAYWMGLEPKEKENDAEEVGGVQNPLQSR